MGANLANLITHSQKPKLFLHSFDVLNQLQPCPLVFSSLGERQNESSFLLRSVETTRDTALRHVERRGLDPDMVFLKDVMSQLTLHSLIDTPPPEFYSSRPTYSQFKMQKLIPLPLRPWSCAQFLVVYPYYRSSAEFLFNGSNCKAHKGWDLWQNVYYLYFVETSGEFNNFKITTLYTWFPTAF